MILYSLYDYDEIIRRIIGTTSPLSGPTCFAVLITYSAPNDVEPPSIEIDIYDNGCEDSLQQHIFGRIIDQNTTIEDYDRMMCSLHEVVDICLEARKHQESFYEARVKQQKRREERRKEQVERGELPF